ncbi:MAG: YkoP family protein [Acetobacteraceae bacterium]
MTSASALRDAAKSEIAFDTIAVERPLSLAPPGYRRSWRDLLWTAAVGTTDIFLRRWYRVREFTDDPTCLLRVSLIQAPGSLRLGDGEDIHAGDDVIMLHIWNEQLPRFFALGADFRWAKMVRRRMRDSFETLARHLASDPVFARVTGIYACVLFSSRRPRWQIGRAAASFGFELVESRSERGPRALGEDMLLWAFARAFNPAALRRHCFRRDRGEVWISRAGLLRRYGRRETIPGRGRGNPEPIPPKRKPETDGSSHSS